MRKIKLVVIFAFIIGASIGCEKESKEVINGGEVPQITLTSNEDGAIKQKGAKDKVYCTVRCRKSSCSKNCPDKGIKCHCRWGHARCYCTLAGSLPTQDNVQLASTMAMKLFIEQNLQPVSEGTRIGAEIQAIQNSLNLIKDHATS